MKRFIRPSMFAIAAFLATTAVSSAQVVTFAQFSSVTNNVPIVTYTDSGTFATLSGSFGITWVSFADYTNAAQFVAPAYPGIGVVAATVSFSITTTVPGTGGAVVDQPFTSATGTMTVNSNAPINGLTNLLTMTFTGNFSGSTGGTSGTLSGSTPTNTVAYTSQFVDFDNTQSRSYSGAFNSISPVLAITGSFMDSWTARFAQFNFSAAVRPIPEPSTFLLVGGIGLAGFYLHRRRKAKADVQVATPAAA